jgi:hypothetical protein
MREWDWESQGDLPKPPGTESTAVAYHMTRRNCYLDCRDQERHSSLVERGECPTVYGCLRTRLFRVEESTPCEK